jgi:hypothetical protein
MNTVLQETDSIYHCQGKINFFLFFEKKMRIFFTGEKLAMFVNSLIERISRFPFFDLTAR